MAQHGVSGQGKNGGEVTPLPGPSFPAVPGCLSDRIRIQLPARAAELLASFATPGDPSDPLGTERAVDLPRSYATSRNGKENMHAVLLESVISDLATFARSGALPSSSRERLFLLAGIVRGEPVVDDTAMRTATTELVVAARAKLAARRECADKELRRLGSSAAATNVKDASSVTARTINALCELRALHWLTPDSVPHSHICDLGRPALEGLATKLQDGTENALCRADFEDAESFISLHEQVLSLLQHGRLDRSAPSHLSPLPHVGKPSAAGQKPALNALLRGATRPSGYAPLAPSVSLELPTIILESRCAADFLKEQKGWTTHDDSPTDELLEKLVDALPLSAHEIASLNPSQDGPFPPAVRSYLELLSRLWFHGNGQGLMSFAIVLGPAAEHAELLQRTGYYAQLSTPYWMRLVKLASSWSQRPPAGRQALWADDGPELKATVARGIWMVSCMFAGRLELLLKERTLAASAGVEGLARDCEALRAGAEALQPHLESPQLANLMERLSTSLGPSLIRGFRALEMPNDSEIALLQKAQQLPTSFGDTDLERTLQDFCAFIRQAATEASEVSSASAFAVLSKSFNDGDVRLFVSQLDSFLALAAAAPEDSLVRTKHLRSVDELTRNFINLITEGFKAEITGAKTEAAKIESLRNQLGHFADLREVIAAREAVLGPIRKNHLAEEVGNTLNSTPDVSIALINELCHELSVADAESTRKIARLVTLIPGCLRRLRARAPEVVDQFRALSDRYMS